MQINVDSTATDTAPVTETAPAVDTAPVTEAPASSEAPSVSGTEAPAPAPYVPNFKYKVMKEEREIPEWVRGTITTPELEKQARELFERADGLETVKSHRDQLQQEMKEIAPFVAEVQEALGYAKQGDLQSFFEKVGLPERAILEYALKRVELQQDPNALAAHEQGRRQQHEQVAFQRERQAFAEQQQQMLYQQREFELNTHLARPEVTQTSAAIDGVLGAGAFRSEVIRRGQAYAAIGQDPSVEQVVSEVLQHYSKLAPSQQAPVVPATTVQSPAQQKAKPTLPNIQSGGQSPVKKTFKSTDEMRAYAKTLSS